MTPMLASKTIVTAVITLLFLLSMPVQSAEPAKTAGKPAAAAPSQKKTSLEFNSSAVTGDLDDMIKRRRIRVLVTYSKTFYFVDKGTQRGTSYDLFRKFEEDLNVKLKSKHLRVEVVFVPVSRDQLLPALLAGRGDIAVANLTVTEEREKLVDFSVPVMTNVKEIIVTGPQSPALASVDDLSGKEIFVRPTSSYHQSLRALNEKFEREGKSPLTIRAAPENLEDEDLLEMLNAGLVKMLVVDDHKAVFWKQIFPNLVLHPEIAVRSGGKIAWAIRKDSPLLKAELDAFAKQVSQGSSFGNEVLKRYLKSTRYVKSASAEAEMKKFRALVAVFRRYGNQYSIDWMLMAAQGYQESRLDQQARSQVGAIGVMQVMPATGAELRVGDINLEENNIHAGIKYMRQVVDTFYNDPAIDELNRVLFAFAAYNCGPGRMKQLRRDTEKRGLDPNVWFNNVEVLAAEKVGRETVTYVSNIYKYYIAYKLTQNEYIERRNTKQEMLNQQGK